MHAGLIALTDCNCFYVSAHRLFEPHLIGKPVVALSNGDGNVVSRSNEAKALGIKMAQPWFELKNLVKRHGLVGRSSQYCLYGEVSNRVLDVMRTFSPVIEPYSIYAGSFWSSFFGVRNGGSRAGAEAARGAQSCLQDEHRTGEHRALARTLDAPGEAYALGGPGVIADRTRNAMRRAFFCFGFDKRGFAAPI